MGSAELMLIAGLLLVAVAVYLFVSTIFKSNEEAKALSWASGDEPVKSKSPLVEFSRPLVHQFTLQHAVRIKSQSYRESVQKKILTSGLSDEINVDEFIGLQMLWGILLPVILTFLNLTLDLGYPHWMPVVLGFGGIMFPHLYANAEKKKRYISVVADLPFFIDLLALSTEAGLDFIGAIQRIVEKADNSILASEFEVVLKDIKLGSTRAESLRSMSRRVDIAEVTSFVNVVVDADATGASISQVLKDQSIQMRVERFTRAEKAGAKASQAILIPLMVFILPAVFIMVFAPVILQFMFGGGSG